MNSNIAKIILVSLLLLILQVVIFNRIHLFGCATPLLLVYVIIILPLDTPRWASLLIGFFLGLISDVFTNTPGVATTTLTFIAFIQHPLLHSIITQDYTDNFSPSLRTLGISKFLIYSLILTFTFCTLLFLLENFGFSRGIWLLLDILGSTALTYLFIFTLENVRRG